ncbi:hypothetical protein V1514DRAFT_318056 [Lipomyces japonicus]|uniref:uncharacterized protein n=1 Tax=Lipomyces japonicus TaxID=56871 RepID=UPI0034CE7F5B
MNFYRRFIRHFSTIAAPMNEESKAIPRYGGYSRVVFITWLVDLHKIEFAERCIAAKPAQLKLKLRTYVPVVSNELEEHLCLIRHRNFNIFTELVEAKQQPNQSPKNFAMGVIGSLSDMLGLDAATKVSALLRRLLEPYCRAATAPTVDQGKFMEVVIAAQSAYEEAKLLTMRSGRKRHADEAQEEVDVTGGEMARRSKAGYWNRRNPRDGGYKSELPAGKEPSQ